jgi:hypothetical protein
MYSLELKSLGFTFLITCFYPFMLDLQLLFIICYKVIHDNVFLEAAVMKKTIPRLTRLKIFKMQHTLTLGFVDSLTCDFAA